VKWALRILIGLVALMVLAVAGTVIFLHTSYGKELVRAKAEAAIADVFPGSTVESVEPGLFGTTTVHGVVIAGEGNQKFVTVDSIDVDVALWPLLTKTVRVTKIAVDGVVVASNVKPSLKPDEAETTPPAPPSSSAWTIELADITVKHASVQGSEGAVLVENLRVGAALELTGGALIASARVTGKFRDKRVVATARVHRAGGVTTVPLATASVGDDGISVLSARYDGDEVAGTVIGRVAAKTVKELTGVELGADVGVVGEPRADGSVDVQIESGSATVHAMLAIVPGAKRARAVVIADAPDLAAIATGVPPGRASVIVTLEASKRRAQGVITVKGERDGHAGSALIAFDATRTGAWVAIGATTDVAREKTSIVATLERKGDVIDLVKGTFATRAGHVEIATGHPDGPKKPPAIIGAAIADLTAKGRIWPDPDVRVDGTVDARAISYDVFRTDSASVRISDLHAKQTGVTGGAHLDVAGARRAGALLGSLALDAHVSAARGGAIAIDLDSHKFASTKSGTWAGTGGHLSIDDTAIVLAHFHTGNGIGKVDADGSFERATGNVKAHAEAKSFTLAMLGPGFAGTIGGSATLARARGRWDGTASFTGKGVTVSPERPPLDATGTLAIHGRKLDATVAASNPTLGQVKVLTELETPPDPLDVAAWMKRERSAIHTLQIALGEVQLSGAKPELSGSVDGDVEITATGASGTLHLRGLHTPQADVEGEVTLGPDEHGHIVATLAARVAGLADAAGDGEMALPVHVFDPAEWKLLGRDVLAGGHVHADNIAIDPDKLARLGVKAPYRARIDLSAELSTGATSLTAHAAVHDLKGGPLMKPLEAVADATIDETSTRASASVKSGTLSLVALDAHSPITLDGLRTTPITAGALEGSLALPVVVAAGQPAATIPARDLLALIGRDDVLGGTLSGTVELAGTIGAPTAHAIVTAKDVAIRASVEGRPPAKLADLKLDARWDGVGGNVDLLAHESDKAMLHVQVRGSPQDLPGIEGEVDATAFDLAPLAAFAPGPVGASRGVLEANLALKGVDPATGDVHGKVHIHDARIPLHALIGTMRNGDFDFMIQDHFVDGKIAGKIGSGTVGGAVSVQLAGSTPVKADAELDIKKISLIRAHQPVIDAHVEAHFKHSDRWTGDVEIAHGHVFVPSTGGHKLLESSAPSDLLFVDAAPKVAAYQRPPPSRPWLVANIKILPTTVEVQDDQYQVSGRASGKLALSVGGDGIGAEGAIDAERGDIQLFGQRSQLDFGTVTFDGTLDPLLEIQVARDLGSINVAVDVGGRASAPTVVFTSDTGSYSQGELLAYFVGGQPGGDRGEVGQAAIQAGAGVASQFLSKRLNKGLEKILPIKLDIDMRYEAATSTNSEAIGFGKQLGEDTYLEYRQHVEARPDENANEGMIEYRIRHTDWRLRGEIGDRNYDSGEIEHRWHW
jgi:hypothetical protein